MKRIAYTVQGSWTRNNTAPAYALVPSDEAPIAAIKRALERVSGDTAVTCRLDSCTAKRDPRTYYYQITMGRPVPRRLGGGYNVTGEVWVTYTYTREEEVKE